jgi:hypothetical protein
MVYKQIYVIPASVFCACQARAALLAVFFLFFFHADGCPMSPAQWLHLRFQKDKKKRRFNLNKASRLLNAVCALRRGGGRLTREHRL